MINQIETTQLSDADFLALVESSRAQGERLSFTVQTSARRAYLAALLAGSNDAELHVKEPDGPSAELLQARTERDEALQSAAQANQELSAARPVIDKAQAAADEVIRLRAENSDLRDQLAQSRQDHGNQTAALRQALQQAQTEVGRLQSQVAANADAADIVKAIRG